MENKVKKKFNLYPDQIKLKMESLRNLIYEVAQNTEGVGELEETLKWGEPSYLPFQTKSGTTIRIDWKPKSADQKELIICIQMALRYHLDKNTKHL